MCGPPSYVIQFAALVKIVT